MEHTEFCNCEDCWWARGQKEICPCCGAVGDNCPALNEQPTSTSQGGELKMETAHTPKVIVSTIRGEQVVHLEWADGARSWMPNIETANTLAAAPELLEAAVSAILYLRRLNEYRDGNRELMHVYDKLRAAEQKATSQKV